MLLACVQGKSDKLGISSLSFLQGLFACPKAQVGVPLEYTFIYINITYFQLPRAFLGNFWRVPPVPRFVHVGEDAAERDGILKRGGSQTF